MNQPLDGRPVPPHSLEAEQRVLGALLRDTRANDHVEGLHALHFVEPVHARIFSVCMKLAASGRRPDALTVGAALDGDQGLAEIGGREYLVQLAQAGATPRQAGDYAHLLVDLHTRRELIAMGEDMQHAGYRAEAGTPALDVARDFERRLFEVTERQEGTGARAFGDLLPEMLAQVQAAQERGGGIIGLSTGLSDLDDLLGGLAPSDLIVLGARPAMGKTALAGTIMNHVAGQGVPVGLFSLEMSGAQVVARTVAGLESIPGDRLRTGQLSWEEMERLNAGCRRLNSLPILIDDTPGLTIEQIRHRARRLHRKHGVSLVIVDHIHRMGRPGINATQELGMISGGLKDLARELNIPVLALCQLNRGVEQREDKRPQLSDLRESGAIEQDADIIAFLYRHAYYLEREEPQRNQKESREKFSDRYADWKSALASARNQAEVYTGKNRHAPTGKRVLHFEPAFTRFTSTPVASDLEECL